MTFTNNVFMSLKKCLSRSALLIVEILKLVGVSYWTAHKGWCQRD